MKNKVVETRSPGKIYIAGEYAVVSGGYAIVFPIQKYVKVKITSSVDYHILSHKYHVNFEKLELSNINESNRYIIEVVKWFNRYLRELGINESKFNIEIYSELDSEENNKFGFGSSGAIIISLLKALFLYYNIEFDSLKLYKSGVMIQSQISKYTSFGDLACIAFDDKVYYKKPDNTFLENINNDSIVNELNKDWDGLVIERLDLELSFLITYTGYPASSYDLVSKVLKHKESNEYKTFLTMSDEITNNIKYEFIFNINHVKELEMNLRYLESFSDANLFTKEMDDIYKIVKKYNGITKFSGAGGGDSVLSFFDSNLSLEKAKEELRNRGYKVLVYPIKEV